MTNRKGVDREIYVYTYKYIIYIYISVFIYLHYTHRWTLDNYNNDKKGRRWTSILVELGLGNF